MPGITTQEPTTMSKTVNTDVPNHDGIFTYEPLPDVRSIMITGGAGFIGGWLAHALAATYAGHYRVVVFDKFDYLGSLNNIQYDDNTNVAIFRGDICCDQDVLTCITAYAVDTIVHLSAQTSVDASVAAPYESTRANVVGTHVVLENAHKCGVRRFIHMSSAEVYGKAVPDADGLGEDALPSPQNPYGASKAASELIVKMYGNKGMKVNIVRSCNIYGPKQFPDKLIPKSIALLQNDRKVTIHGSGADVKHWLYVTDCANAFNTILHRGEPGMVYNLGSHHSSTNYDLCSTIIKKVVSQKNAEEGKDEEVNVTDWMVKIPGRNFVAQPCGLNFHALEDIGFKQFVDLEEGVEKSVEWYGSNATKWWGDLPQILKI